MKFIAEIGSFRIPFEHWIEMRFDLVSASHIIIFIQYILTYQTIV